MSQLLRYKYTDSPDGQDIYLKALVASKYAGLAATFLGTWDVLMYSHPKGVGATLRRFGWYIGPMVGMASAFTVTANIARNVRGSDDKFNYFLGGAVAGSILSSWQRAPVFAFPGAVLFGVIGVLIKTGLQENWDLSPELHQATKTIKSVKHDWTFVKDLEDMKGWTKGV